jgi:hypothetical protein
VPSGFLRGGCTTFLGCCGMRCTGGRRLEGFRCKAGSF